jgi:putative FmdB family regulatory protein
MPTYDYKCNQCGYLFEVEQRITEPPLQFCPKCKGTVNRLIAPVGILFKGSGFHVTDYRDSKKVPVTEKIKKEDSKSQKISKQ